LLVTATSGQAATYYWDNNGASNGFGAAGGTWAVPTLGGMNGWSTNSTGVSVIDSNTTTTADFLFFGTHTNGLAAGTLTVSNTPMVGELVFGQASGAITLEGSTIDMSTPGPTVGGWARIVTDANGGTAGATHTFNCSLQKTNGGSIVLGNQTTSKERYVLNGVISGNASFESRVANNTGTITLNGTNTFSGNISIVTGQLNIDSVTDAGVNGSLGAGSVISMGGGGGQNPTFWYTGASEAVMNRTFNLFGGGDRIVSQDAPLTLSGNMTGLTGGFESHLQLCGDAGGGSNFNTIAGVIGSNVRLELLDFAPVGGLADSTNRWRLSGANTYSGSTTIRSGILQADAADVAGVSSALGSGGNIIFIGGTLQYTTNSAGTDYSARINNSGQAIRLDTNGENVTLTNTISSSNIGGLTKLGAGKLTIVNGFAYGGATTINEGTLKFAGTSGAIQATPGASSVINNGATWELEDTGSDNRISFWDETVIFGDAGGGTIDFIRGNFLMQLGVTYETLGGSKNTITSSGAPGAGHMNMQSGTITFDVADGTDAIDLEVTPYVHGNPHFSAGTVIKEGTGVVAMAYNGNSFKDTIVNAGTLLVNGKNSGSGTATVNSGGTLGGTGIVASVVSLSSGGHLAPGVGGIGTLTLSEGLTLNDGAVLKMDVNSETHSNDLIMVTGGTIMGSAPNGVTVHVVLSGQGSGVYTLMDWTAATESGLELADFNVVTEGNGGGSVEISNKQLLLHVTRGLVLLFR
jgi:fibronectin-binding autotransporter adhesin